MRGEGCERGDGDQVEREVLSGLTGAGGSRQAPQDDKTTRRSSEIQLGNNKLRARALTLKARLGRSDDLEGKVTERWVGRSRDEMRLKHSAMS